jgi:D-amino-acid dehydrogenase
VGTREPGRPPSRVVVVGAGIVGLSCAWSLQEHGVDVRVLERRAPGAGASWQNAGYVSPALCVPLPEPSILRYGVRAVLRPRSPVGLLSPTDVRLLRFMAEMARHCTAARWRRSMRVYRDLNAQVDGAFERQRAGGVAVGLVPSDVLTCFERAGESAGVLHELDGIVASGQPVSAELLTGDEARRAEPHLSERVTVAVRVRGQHHLTPSRYVAALARSVAERGGTIVEARRVDAVVRRADTLVVSGPSGDVEADAVVLANGAWLGDLARPHGVTVPVYGGRGYSFTAPCDGPLGGTLYFPAPRIAVTPQDGRARFAGIMEFGSPDAPARRGRIGTMVRDVRPLLDGVDLDAREDEWVGPRPLSADGLPLVGETRTRGLFVAGGHGMWGVTLGPLTGLLLAELVATGHAPAPLDALDPCRGR